MHIRGPNEKRTTKEKKQTARCSVTLVSFFFWVKLEFSNYEFKQKKKRKEWNNRKKKEHTVKRPWSFHFFLFSDIEENTDERKIDTWKRRKLKGETTCVALRRILDWKCAHLNAVISIKIAGFCALQFPYIHLRYFSVGWFLDLNSLTFETVANAVFASKRRHEQNHSTLKRNFQQIHFNGPNVFNAWCIIFNSFLFVLCYYWKRWLWWWWLWQ